MFLSSMVRVWDGGGRRDRQVHFAIFRAVFTDFMLARKLGEMIATCGSNPGVRPGGAKEGLKLGARAS